jgi:uncharacterized protein YcbK (DUF882 family)
MTTTARGPSPHLSWAELACKDGTPYPEVWRLDRLVDLVVTFEDLRAELGGLPIRVVSAYRTPAYNSRLEGAAVKSQHVEGRALDLQHSRLSAAKVYQRIRAMHADGRLPLLGGVGLYRTFVHIDTRPPKAPGRLALWAGKGVHL